MTDTHHEESALEVRLPAKLPDLTPGVAKALLTIVTARTEAQILEQPEPEEGY